MIVVIFELEPHAGQSDHYFEWAGALQASLMDVDGFVSIERFESVGQPGRYLSLSFWRDEAAVRQWRSMAAHRAAQVEGRSRIFAHYRLREAEVIRDYGLLDRAQAPDDSVRALG